MSTRPDFDRAIAAWLIDQVPERASERLLEASRDEIRTTRQRRVSWPAWRFPFMNTYAKLALAAAAVLAIAVVGINLLPGGQTGPGSPPSATASPPATPTPAASPAFTFPEGIIAAGPQAAEVLGVPFTFEAPGWHVRPGDMPAIERSSPTGDRAWIAFWDPSNVYVWPCAAQPVDPPAGPTTTDLVAAMEQIRGMGRTAPSEQVIDGRAATYVEMTILGTLDCEATSLWYLEHADGSRTKRIVSPPGATTRTWIVDVNGRRFLVDSDQTGDDPELTSAVQAVVDSIRFE